MVDKSGIVTCAEPLQLPRQHVSHALFEPLDWRVGYLGAIAPPVVTVDLGECSA
jgi:hypothetical protein